MRKKFASSLVFAGLVIVPVHAAPIIIDFVGTGSVTLATASFSNVTFDIRVVADTNNVHLGYMGRAIETGDSPSTMSLVGFGTQTFLGPVGVFVNNGAAGFGVPDSLDYLDIFDLRLAAYDLKSNFGPVFVQFPLFLPDQFINVPTSGGPLSLRTARDVTFTAVVVPEPLSFLLSVFGVLGIAIVLRSCRA